MSAVTPDKESKFKEIIYLRASNSYVTERLDSHDSIKEYK